MQLNAPLPGEMKKKRGPRRPTPEEIEDSGFMSAMAELGSV